MLYPHTLRNLAESCTFGMGTMFTATLGLAEMSPQIATLVLIVPDQRIDPLMTHLYPRQRRHKTANLLWTPFFPKPVSYSIDQARSRFVHFQAERRL
ncbi:hypothetical protein HORIV_53870 [Vreelandella olivaria]|uniref:Uncharacterized protein n=1 Tax=Vreelandella olivaria TaxID=390919 RepID=A0ABM7GQK5_9GAMM|nr:hypothetical protein HORIV_53870 [Halomonas olivaria]